MQAQTTISILAALAMSSAWSAEPAAAAPQQIENSLGMKFVLIRPVNS